MRMSTPTLNGILKGKKSTNGVPLKISITDDINGKFAGLKCILDDTDKRKV